MTTHSRGSRLVANKTNMGSSNAFLTGPGGRIQTGGTPSALRGPRARRCDTCDARIGESCQRQVGGKDTMRRWVTMRTFHRGR